MNGQQALAQDLPGNPDVNAAVQAGAGSGPAPQLTQSQIDSLNQQLQTRLQMLAQFKQMYLNATTPDAEQSALNDYDGQLAAIKNLQAQLGSTFPIITPPTSGTGTSVLSDIGTGVYNVGWYFGMVESNLVAQVDGVKMAVLDPLVYAGTWIITLGNGATTLPPLKPLQIVPLTPDEYAFMAELGTAEGQTINLYMLVSGVYQVGIAIPSIIQNVDTAIMTLVSLVGPGGGGSGLAGASGGVFGIATSIPAYVTVSLSCWTSGLGLIGGLGALNANMSAGDSTNPVYDGSPKHGPTTRQTSKGAANPAPTNGQAALDASVQIKPTSPRRVGVDKAAGDFVVFDETSSGVFHAHVRTWAELTQEMKNALIRAGLVSLKGNIL